MRYARRWAKERGQSTAAAYVPLSFAPGAQQRNAVLVGGTGTGKTHLAIAIARSCIRGGARGRFYNVVDLVNRLETETRNGRQGRLADHLTRMDFIVIIAKLDRLTRNTRLLLTLLDAGVDVVFCDLPQVPPGAMGRFFVTQMVAVAELEAGLTGERTRAALAQAKKRGVRLGNPRLSEVAGKGAKANREAADRFAANVLPVIRDIQKSGATSLRAVATALTARGVPTARGGTWTAVHVNALLRRAS
jgi:DNA invertase Pin-like site-specific DNA recombinase